RSSRTVTISLICKEHAYVDVQESLSGRRSSRSQINRAELDDESSDRDGECIGLHGGEANADGRSKLPAQSESLKRTSRMAQSGHRRLGITSKGGTLRSNTVERNLHMRCFLSCEIHKWRAWS